MHSMNSFTVMNLLYYFKQKIFFFLKTFMNYSVKTFKSALRRGKYR